MLVSLLVGLLIFAIVYWAAMKIMSAFGIGDPIRTVVLVILVLLLLFWVLRVAGVMPAGL